MNFYFAFCTQIASKFIISSDLLANYIATKKAHKRHQYSVQFSKIMNPLYRLQN